MRCQKQNYHVLPAFIICNNISLSDKFITKKIFFGKNILNLQVEIKSKKIIKI